MRVTPVPDRVYAASLARFADYAGLQAPALPSDPLSSTQVRLHRWMVHNFPGSTEEQLVLGLVEELAELCTSMSLSESLDAIGDVQIFATQICTSSRLDFGTLLAGANVEQRGTLLAGANVEQREKVEDYELRALSGVGLVARAVLKSATGIRGYTDPAVRRRAIADGIFTIAGAMRGFAETLGSDDVELYRGVAEGVMRRDWRASPESGGAI